jgi:PKD repeat protein
VPVVVSFDASKSKVTDKNIDKFIFDYWDGTKPESRDAKNTGHKYTQAWEYMVKLTVITDDWVKYSLIKKIVLKHRAQKAVITTSMKKAPVNQTIDFSAEDSIWEVAKYFWDFWDWEISTEVSPNHFYKKPWKYKVTLTLEFTNKNELTTEKIIEIYEE